MRKGKFLFFIFMTAILIVPPLHGAEPDKILKVGLTVPLTGAGAPWGITLLRTVKLEAEQYNAAGGLTIEGQNYKIEVISEDDKYSPSEGVTVTNKLIFKDKVKFIFGPVGSAVIMSTRPIIEPNQVISIVTGYTPKALGRIINSLSGLIPPWGKPSARCSNG